MNAKANKTLIGAFIIGALALAVAGIILFSSVGYFSQRPEYVMYFEGSVKGLYEGAPVVFRGVRIGSVKNISLHFDPDDASVRIPVQVQLDPQTITGAQSRQAQEQYFKQLIDKLVERCRKPVESALNFFWRRATRRSRALLESDQRVTKFSAL